LRYGVGLFTLSPAVPYGFSLVTLLSPLVRPGSNRRPTSVRADAMSAASIG
jgi:hypothetical protein